MMLVAVAVIQHDLRQMLRQEFGRKLQKAVGKMLRQEGDFFGDAVGFVFGGKEFGQVVRARVFNHVKHIFAIHFGDVKRFAVDVFARHGQRFEAAEHIAADLREHVGVVGADVEHGSLRFGGEGVQAHGEHGELARAARRFVMPRGVGVEASGRVGINFAHMVAIGVVVPFAACADVFALVMMSLQVG